MISPTIISLAILKVNWDQLGKDYLENFVPTVAECIRLSRDDVVSVPSLQDRLQTQFGLRIPQNVINTILRRLKRKRHGYIRLENKAYIRNPEKLAQLKFHEIQQQVVRSYEHLINSLITFCSEKFGITYSVENAEAALLSYLEENQLFVVDAAGYGTVIPPTKDSVKNGDGSITG